MRRLTSKIIFCVGAAAMLGLLSAPAYADGITFLGPDPCFPAGVGRGCGSDRSPHVLTLQHHGREQGSVGRSTTSSEDVRTGDWQRGSNTRTVSLTEIGTTQASDIRIFFDINDPLGQSRNAVTLNSLVLTAYDEAGAAVFSASLIGSPLDLQQLGNGQGHSDYVFGLDAAAASRLQAVIDANPNLRFGLAADITASEGGPESFFIGSAGGPAEVPEPATMILLGTGIAGVAAKVRRRRRAAQTPPE